MPSSSSSSSTISTIKSDSTKIQHLKDYPRFKSTEPLKDPVIFLKRLEEHMVLQQIKPEMYNQLLVYCVDSNLEKRLGHA